MKPFVATGKTNDIANDAFSQRIILFQIQKFWRFDLDKIEITGFIDDSSHTHKTRVSVLNGDEVGWDATFETSFYAVLQIKANPGFTIQEAMGTDFISKIEAEWLSMQGFPANYPCGIECEVENDRLRIELIPCA